MKKILTILFILSSFVGYSQKVPQTLGNKNTIVTVQGSMAIDSFFRIPLDTLASASNGSIAIKGTDIYKKISGIWIVQKGDIYTNAYGLLLNSFAFSVDTAVAIPSKLRLTKALDSLKSLVNFTNGYGLNLSSLVFSADTISMATRGRLYKVADSIKNLVTYTNGYGLLLNSLTFRVDTSLITTWALTKKKIDSLGALKLNITDTANKWVTSAFRRSDSVFVWRGGVPYFVYKDSVGAGALSNYYLQNTILTGFDSLFYWPAWDTTIVKGRAYKLSSLNNLVTVNRPADNSDSSTHWQLQVNQGNFSLSSLGGLLNLSQIASGGATTNQAIVWNGTTWVPGTVAASMTTTDKNLIISGSTISTNKTFFNLGSLTGAVTHDMTNGFNAKLTATGNITLSFTNLQDGSYFTLRFFQDATGGRTLTVPGAGVIPVKTAANDSTLLTMIYQASNSVYLWTSSASSSGITALTGDVTASGSGSVVATISNDAVTFPKFQNINATRLLGRYSATVGDMQEIVLGSGLLFSNDTLKATGSGTPTLTNTYVGVGDASNLLSGSSALTYSGGILNITASDTYLKMSSTAGNGLVNYDALGDFAFWTASGGTRKMKLKNDGELLIGPNAQSGVDQGAYILQIEGNIYATSNLLWMVTSGASTVLRMQNSSNSFVLDKNGTEVIFWPNGSTGEQVFTDTEIYPFTNGGNGLGKSGNGWSNLFLASGAVINFNAGDVNITHSLNNLSLTGGTFTLGTNAIETGQVLLANGGAGGASVTIQNNSATTAYNFNLPTTAGVAGYVLTSQGGGTAAMTWTNPTSIYNIQNGLTLAGSTIKLGGNLTENTGINGTGTYSLSFGNFAPTATYGFRVDFTNNGTDTTGDIFYRNANGWWNRLPVGTANQVLTVSGGLPAWTAITNSITGTANQILVNGTSGTAQTGAITLTLPQNINTTANVQFNDIQTSSITATNYVKTAGFKVAYAAKIAAYTITSTDYMIDYTSGTFTVTLPSAIGITGQIFVIKNSGTGTITIAPNGTETIDGATSKTLTVQYSGYTLMSDGANFKIIGTF